MGVHRQLDREDGIPVPGFERQPGGVRFGRRIDLLLESHPQRRPHDQAWIELQALLTRSPQAAPVVLPRRCRHEAGQWMRPRCPSPENDIPAHLRSKPWYEEHGLVWNGAGACKHFSYEPKAKLAIVLRAASLL